MLRFTRRMLSVAMIGLLLPVAGAPAFAGASGSGPGTNCVTGDAEGSWNLPSQDAPGMVQGMLKNDNGETILGIKALLQKPSSLGEAAKMKGVLIAMTPMGPKVVAQVRGMWKVTGPGEGQFAAIFVKKTSPTGPEVKVGSMKGKFQFAAGGDGMFKAKYKLCM